MRTRRVMAATAVVVASLSGLGAAPTPAGATVTTTMTVAGVANVSQYTGNQFEGSVAIDPTDPQRVFVLGRDESGNLLSARSADGGTTWTHARVGASIANGGLPSGWGNTSVAFDEFGNLFVVYLSTTAHLYVDFAVSTDGGATFSNVQALDNLADQPVVATGHGSVWVTYTRGGLTTMRGAAVTGLGQLGAFGTVETIPSMVGQSFGDLAVGPDGQVVYAAGPNLTGTSVKVSIDPDGLGPLGFSTAVPSASTTVPGFDLIPAAPDWGVDSEAHLAWDLSTGPHRGRLYLCFLDAPSTDLANTQVEVQWSDDGGSTWSSPVRVNDDSGNASHFMPGFAVDRTTGAVAATWYDTRNDTTRATAQYYGAVSSDGGTTWTTNVPIAAGASNQAGAPPPYRVRDTDYGDYTGLAFDAGTAVAVWADNSNSTGDNPAGAGSTFDLYTAALAVTVPGVAPVVTSDPNPAAVVAGATYAFTAAASGVPTPAVQWERSNDAGTTWAPIAGATSTTYSASASAVDDGAEFRAAFQNVAGSARSGVASLSVASAPVVTIVPLPQSVAAGATYVFTAAASGVPTPAVQWERSNDAGTTWVPIAGATTNSYSAVAVLAATGAQFRAVFSNSQGATPSPAATLTVRRTATMSVTAPKSARHTSTLKVKVALVGAVGSTPTGTVTVARGGSVLATATLDRHGKAVVAISNPAIGTAVLAVAYVGDGNYVPLASSVVVTVK